MQKNKKTILVITDGIGHNESNFFNAFYHAKKPTYEKMFATFPHSLIQTSGLSVGLPEGQMGNSEVGHMTIGSGRILYQNLVKINRAIEDKSLENNENLLNFFSFCHDIHIVGLLSDGGVHSHINHIIALAKIAKKNHKKVFIHALSDGRDVGQKDCEKYIKQIENILDDDIVFASLGGRFFAMDRDNRWDRIKKAYETIANANPKSDLSVKEYLKKCYKMGEFDEFITPVAFKNYQGFGPNDGVIFANFRNDRMRQFCSCFLEDFDKFKTKTRPKILTMTNYDNNFPFDVLFEKENLTNTLSEIIAKHNLTQFHTAETEKYAHVTFFFNGGIEECVKNEKRVLVPSPKVATYDLCPKMSAKKVTKEVLKAMVKGYDFIVVNYANGDMVGHTGNFEASIQAVEAVDESLGEILEKSKDYNVLIVSDHGNCEELKDKNENALTNHTTFDVYCFLKAKGYDKIQNGGLSNIAPTILKLMGLQIPSQMDNPLI